MMRVIKRFMKLGFARFSLATAIVLWPSILFAAEGDVAEGSWFALIFYAINFVLFLWIVRKYGWPAITRFFHDRSRSIREIRGRAEKAYQDAQQLAALAAQQLQQLDADQRKM